jgi:hypothetical protein
MVRLKSYRLLQKANEGEVYSMKVRFMLARS